MKVYIINTYFLATLRNTICGLRIEHVVYPSADEEGGAMANARRLVKIGGELQKKVAGSRKINAWKRSLLDAAPRLL